MLTPDQLRQILRKTCFTYCEGNVVVPCGSSFGLVQNGSFSLTDLRALDPRLCTVLARLRAFRPDDQLVPSIALHASLLFWENPPAFLLRHEDEEGEYTAGVVKLYKALVGEDDNVSLYLDGYAVEYAGEGRGLAYARDEGKISIEMPVTALEAQAPGWAERYRIVQALSLSAQEAAQHVFNGSFLPQAGTDLPTLD